MCKKTYTHEAKKVEFPDGFYARRCTCCENPMNQGFVVNNGDEYYCGDECLTKHYTLAEWAEMTQEIDNGEHYFTVWNIWDDATDVDFEVVNGVVKEIEPSI